MATRSARRSATRRSALGFDAVGFAKAALAPRRATVSPSFLAAGYHGDMGWLAGKAERRGDPQTLWPEARTVVVLGVNYGPTTIRWRRSDSRERGAISVYARGRDYHDILKKRLKALARWIAERWPGELKVFVDTAPVMEKPLAQAGRHRLAGQAHQPGLARIRLLAVPRRGLSRASTLEPDAAESDHCGACRRCLDACPTAAFPAPYRLDARRCISYLTIEHKGHDPARAARR